MLLVCLGAATRLSDYLMRSGKVYRARITFGSSTSTYDAGGEVIAVKNTSHINLSDIEKKLALFRGEIKQIPPMYSAIKIKGKKLYELARQGKTIERPPRRVQIDSLRILSWHSPTVELEIECSAGTYIRSLAHDLGEALGTGAHLAGLTRLASGQFSLRDSISLETVRQDGDWMGRIIPPFEALSQYPRLTLDTEAIEEVRQGRFIPRQQDIDEQVVFAFDAEKQLVAILQPRDQQWKPHKVFPK